MACMAPEITFRRVGKLKTGRYIDAGPVISSLSVITPRFLICRRILRSADAELSVTELRAEFRSHSEVSTELSNDARIHRRYF